MLGMGWHGMTCWARGCFPRHRCLMLSISRPHPPHPPPPYPQANAEAEGLRQAVTTVQQELEVAKSRMEAAVARSRQGE